MFGEEAAGDTLPRRRPASGWKARLPAIFSAAAQVQIEGDFLPCSFSILEEQPMDMLLGLDMLKRHQVSSGRLRLAGVVLPERVSFPSWCQGSK